VTEPHISLPRSFTGIAIATALFLLLLLGVRDSLTPPFLFLIFLWAMWPHRERTDARGAMALGGALIGLWFLDNYGGLLTPFIVALAIAYLIAPAVGKLEEKKVSRGIAIAVVVVPCILVTVAILSIAIPQLSAQAQALIDKIPDFARRAVAWVDGIGERLALIPGLSAEQRHSLTDIDAERFAQFLQAHAQEILRQIGEFGLNMVSHLGTMLGLLAYLIIIPVLAFYLLSDWRILTAEIRNLVPPSKREAVFGFLQEYDTTLGKFIRGTLIEAGIVGVLTTVLLTIAGVPSAFLIGVITGVFNLIPFVGFVISIVPAFVVALTMDDPGTGLLKVLVVFIIVQFVDGNVTGPKIIGDSVGLHPVWIMIALVLAGAFFGFVGLLLAIPMAVFVRMIASRVVARYKQSEMYKA
jgi:predicted PurR-regulated permease PerM